MDLSVPEADPACQRAGGSFFDFGVSGGGGGGRSGGGTGASFSPADVAAASRPELPYASPELVEASSPLTTATDVFSLGALAASLLSAERAPLFPRGGSPRAHLSAVRALASSPGGLSSTGLPSGGCGGDLAVQPDNVVGLGRLGGTGKVVILPVDQGFEHGPARSFAPNPPGYEPHYHWQLAVDAGLSAFAAPLGMIEDGAASFAGAVPTILKVNSANSLNGEKDGPVQAITADVQDALRLGCSAIGYTIYPGSANAYDMMNDLRELTAEAKDAGLAVVVWSYPRGQYVTKEGETGFDVIAYAAHMAALMGAHIIKVKLPTDYLEAGEAKKVYEAHNIPRGTLAQRVNHIVQSCFGGRRIVVFSGGAKKGEEALYDEAKAIRDGGGNGSIVGRNAFQRPLPEAMNLLGKLIDIYKGKEE